MQNLAQPLLLDQGIVNIFVRDNRCGICLSHLLIDFAPDHKYTVRCPHHGVIYATSTVSFWDAQKATQNSLSGQMAMRQAKLARQFNPISETRSDR